jgi:hypothetical protein
VYIYIHREREKKKKKKMMMKKKKKKERKKKKQKKKRPLLAAFCFIGFLAHLYSCENGLWARVRISHCVLRVCPGSTED